MKIGRFRPEVLAAVSQAPSVKKQVRLVAAEVRKRARQRVKRRTGHLRRNIAIENVYDPKTKLVEYRVGWKKVAWYGSMVELGSEGRPAQPHLRPAADEVKNR